MDRGDTAFPINQECRREGFHSTIKLRYRIIAHHDAVIDVELMRKRLHYVPAVLIH